MRLLPKVDCHDGYEVRCPCCKKRIVEGLTRADERREANYKLVFICRHCKAKVVLDSDLVEVEVRGGGPLHPYDAGALRGQQYDD